MALGSISLEDMQKIATAIQSTRTAVEETVIDSNADPRGVAMAFAQLAAETLIRAGGDKGAYDHMVEAAWEIIAAWEIMIAKLAQ